MALQQTAFERAVRHQLPSAFAASLERVDEFEVGKVLVLHRKPRFWRLHRWQALDFTGLHLTALLEDLDVRTQSRVGLTSDTDTTEKTFRLNLGADAELKMQSLEILGKLTGKGSLLFDMCFDFGKVEHIVGDVFQALSGRQWTVDAKHPVVRDALRKGKEMYVISSVYQASKIDVKVCNCHVLSYYQFYEEISP